jgi:hypothetical protein
MSVTKQEVEARHKAGRDGEFPFLELGYFLTAIIAASSLRTRSITLA